MEKSDVAIHMAVSPIQFQALRRALFATLSELEIDARTRVGGWSAQFASGTRRDKFEYFAAALPAVDAKLRWRGEPFSREATAECVIVDGPRHAEARSIAIELFELEARESVCLDHGEAMSIRDKRFGLVRRANEILLQDGDAPRLRDARDIMRHVAGLEAGVL